MKNFESTALLNRQKRPSEDWTYTSPIPAKTLTQVTCISWKVNFLQHLLDFFLSMWAPLQKMRQGFL